MIRNVFLVLTALLITIAVGTRGVAARPSDHVFRLPAGAVAITDELYSLGNAYDPGSGRQVEGYAILKFKNENARGQAAKPAPGGSTCYAFLARGAKWKVVEPWLMNPANTRGLSGNTLFSTQASAIDKWEDAADGTVGSGAGVNIMGNGTNTNSFLAADSTAPDNLNEIYFGTISNPGVIAVTTVWGNFGGPASQRALVEWDQVFDQTDFDWSLAGEVGKMDFDNIATHEDGHAVGLGHPGSSCTEETMYAYADFGEIKKRSLNSGDVAGISSLY